MPICKLCESKNSICCEILDACHTVSMEILNEQRETYIVSTLKCLRLILSYLYK
jgi:hypothetical protein